MVMQPCVCAIFCVCMCAVFVHSIVFIVNFVLYFCCVCGVTYITNFTIPFWMSYFINNSNFHYQSVKSFFINLSQLRP